MRHQEHRAANDIYVGPDLLRGKLFFEALERTLKRLTIKGPTRLKGTQACFSPPLASRSSGSGKTLCRMNEAGAYSTESAATTGLVEITQGTARKRSGSFTQSGTWCRCSLATCSTTAASSASQRGARQRG